MPVVIEELQADLAPAEVAAAPAAPASPPAEPDERRLFELLALQAWAAARLQAD